MAFNKYWRYSISRSKEGDNKMDLKIQCQHREDRLESICCGVELEEGSKSATDVCSYCQEHVEVAECNACGEEVEL